MALRLKPETREAWKKRVEGNYYLVKHGLYATPTEWRPVPRSEPEPPEYTDMFIKGYVD